MSKTCRSGLTGRRGVQFCARREEFVLHVLIALFSTLGWGPARAAEAKHVLLLHSFGADLQNARSVSVELQRQSPDFLQIFDATIATPTTGGEDPARRYADYLRAVFAYQPPDLAIAIGTPSVRFFIARTIQREIAWGAYWTRGHWPAGHV